MSAYLPLIGALVLHILFWFLLSVIKKRNDVADVAWGLGFVLLAWVSFLLSGPNFVSFCVNILVSIWGIRLAIHIARRHKGKQEDFRYVEWRATWRHFYVRSFLQVFVLQSILLVCIVSPVLFINQATSEPNTFMLVVGFLVWLIGFIFEVVGDLQLKKFLSKKENNGKLMTSGLWKFTRHPNYFGEVTLWWGIWLVACAYPFGFLTIIGPSTITVLILLVSGIPLAEKRYAGRPDFEAYKKKTSVFFPLPPRV